jgi:hypothetical protein
MCHCTLCRIREAAVHEPRADENARAAFASEAVNCNDVWFGLTKKLVGLFDKCNQVAEERRVVVICLDTCYTAIEMRSVVAAL